MVSPQVGGQAVSRLRWLQTSAAIRQSRVDTMMGLSVPAVFPSGSSMFRCPLPSTGSAWVRSPASTVATRHSDSLMILPRDFVSFAATVPPPPVFRSHGGRAPILREPGLLTGFPNRFLDVESSGPPRFLGDPSVHVPRSSTPARPRSQALAAPPVLPSAVSTASALATCSFRGSITRPAHSLSTLRSPGYPGTTQDSLPAGGLLCRARAVPAGSLMRFPLRLYLLHCFLLTQASPGAPKLEPSARNTAPFNNPQRIPLPGGEGTGARQAVSDPAAAARAGGCRSPRAASS